MSLAPRIHYYSTVQPAPQGFEPVEVLTKRHVLAGIVVLLVRTLDEIAAVLPDFEARVRGVVLMIGNGEACSAKLGPLLWQLRWSTAELAQARAWLDAGWLSAIVEACALQEKHHVSELEAGRLAFELGRVREDYNRVTSRLQRQLEELVEAKALVERFNEELESKVAERGLALEQAQDELLRARKMASLGAMMAGFAHEINTPLGNAMLSATTVGEQTQRMQAALQASHLKRSELDQYLAGTALGSEVIQRNLRRTVELLEHFRKSDADAPGEPLQCFRLLDLVRGLVTSFSPSLQIQGHRVEVEVPDTLELNSYAGALSQVLSNLMGNALRHGFEGRRGGCVRIEASLIDGDLVRLSFTDDGHGIDQANLDKIFDPFYTTKLGQGGSGIGLYLVYKLIYRVLAGRMEVQSRVGEGTCFVITLPREPGPRLV